MSLCDAGQGISQLSSAREQKPADIPCIGVLAGGDISESWDQWPKAGTDRKSNRDPIPCAA